MVSIYTDSENYSNYMPVREILEQLGYNVDWDYESNIVQIEDSKVAKSGYYIDEYGSEVPIGYINILDFIPKNFVNINKITNENEVVTMLKGNSTVIDGRLYINEKVAIDYLSNL